MGNFMSWIYSANLRGGEERIEYVGCVPGASQHLSGPFPGGRDLTLLLPDAVLIRIFGLLEYTTLITSCTLVCKKWLHLVASRKDLLRRLVTQRVDWCFLRDFTGRDDCPESLPADTSPAHLHALLQSWTKYSTPGLLRRSAENATHLLTLPDCSGYKHTLRRDALVLYRYHGVNRANAAGEITEDISSFLKIYNLSEGTLIEQPLRLIESEPGCFVSDVKLSVLSSTMRNYSSDGAAFWSQELHGLALVYHYGKESRYPSQIRLALILRPTSSHPLILKKTLYDGVDVDKIFAKLDLKVWRKHYFIVTAYTVDRQMVFLEHLACSQTPQAGHRHTSVSHSFTLETVGPSSPCCVARHLLQSPDLVACTYAPHCLVLCHQLNSAAWPHAGEEGGDDDVSGGSSAGQLARKPLLLTVCHLSNERQGAASSTSQGGGGDLSQTASGQDGNSTVSKPAPVITVEFKALVRYGEMSLKAPPPPPPSTHHLSSPPLSPHSSQPGVGRTPGVGSSSDEHLWNFTTLVYYSYFEDSYLLVISPPVRPATSSQQSSCAHYSTKSRVIVTPFLPQLSFGHLTVENSGLNSFNLHSKTNRTQQVKVSTGSSCQQPFIIRLGCLRTGELICAVEGFSGLEFPLKRNVLVMKLP